MGAAASVVALSGVATAAIHGAVTLVKHFFKPPNANNPTIQNIHEENRRKEEAERHRNEAEQRVRQAKEAEERARKAKEDLQRQREDAEQKAREREEQHRRETEERERREAEEREKFRLELEQQKEQAERAARERAEAHHRENEERERREAEERERVKLEMEQQKQQAEQAAREREEAHRLEMEERERENERLRAIAEEERRLEEERLKAEAERLRQQAEAERQKAIAAEELARESAAEAKRLYESATNGIRPIVFPTDEEVRLAKEKMQYNPELCHFAICGPSGSGKSSLINAFRGLTKTDAGYAEVGENECTSEVSRYPDQRSEVPFCRFVWYDIPGAGTLRVPDWKYFNDHGLYCFDFIILVYDGRFTAIDGAIIKNCKRFGVPVFVVRSKSDQHILNILTSDGLDVEDFDLTDEEFLDDYRVAKERYVVSTRDDFRKNLALLAQESESGSKGNGTAAKLISVDEPVYIISSRNLIKMFGNPKKRRSKKQSPDGETLIDEAILIEVLLQAAVVRRYGGGEMGSGGSEGESVLKELSNKWNLGLEKFHIRTKTAETHDA
ncbi:hypothetical protein BJ508DRAFT_414976 [Ascobolus immersus RN42]|uniref:IRG-type G domain-containing protein n=1 Tax=Ascobolus immersus RN42 TaxID=1160509 RepID=A0A3N4I4U9_ASCIM|nr:hypothetical protein BJ508DRAFT_414976 [Ascobolus immersus RN42]